MPFDSLPASDREKLQELMRKMYEPAENPAQSFGGIPVGELMTLPSGMDYKPSFRITVKANGSETIYEAPTLDECVAMRMKCEVIRDESVNVKRAASELSHESRTFADTTYPAKAEWFGDGKDYAITPCGVSDGQGDSFSLIAKRFGVVVDKLAKQVAEGRFTPASNLSEEPAKHPEGWTNFSEMKQSLADWNSAAINTTISSFHLDGTAEKIIPFGPKIGAYMNAAESDGGKVTVHEGGYFKKALVTQELLDSCVSGPIPITEISLESAESDQPTIVE